MRHRRFISLVFGMLCAIALAVAHAEGSRPSGEATPQVHTVVIEATAFNPPTLVVQRGDTVIWMNKDPLRAG